LISLAEKNEALDHLRITYSFIHYCEPRTDANRRRLAAISRKFKEFAAMPVIGSNRQGSITPRMQFVVDTMLSNDRATSRKIVAGKYDLQSHEVSKLLDSAARRIKADREG
jgi:hypothetical protein